MATEIVDENSRARRVFLLHHIRELEDDAEEVKLIGVYSTVRKAESAIEQLRKLPGFVDAPDGFEINEHTIDQTSWTTGFEIDV
jgi:hypothetical protein